MYEIESGDVVRKNDQPWEMLVIGEADEDLSIPATAVFCVWEQENFLHEEVCAIASLELVRKERRRVIRDGTLHFPVLK